MRILQVIPVFSAFFGGPVRVVRSMSKELARRHEVTVYTTSALDHHRDFGVSPTEVKLDGYRVVYFPRIFKFSKFNFSPAMTRTLRQTLNKHDIIHLHSWRHFQDIIVNYYAKSLGVPYVLQTHGSLPRVAEKQGLKWIYDMFFGHRLLTDASKVIAFTKMEAEQFRNAGVPEGKIEIIPNGIDLSEYDNLPPKGSFRRKFSIDDDEKIILYMGRVHKLKGIDFLAKSFAHLVRSGLKNVKLVIAGPDDGYLNSAKNLASSLGVSRDVVFVGYVPEEYKVSAYVDSTVVVYPGQYEPFGLVSLEAAVVSKPVVVAEGTFMSEVVKEGGFGICVKYGDVEALAKLLELFVVDDVFACEMGTRGRQYVADNYSIEKVVDKLEKLYESVKAT